MKRGIATWLLGMAVLALQGALTRVLPFALAPDVLLLGVVALGLHWQGRTAGLWLVAALGFGVDAVSGSLFGQHALLYLVVFVVTAKLSRPLYLRGSVALALFAALATVLTAGLAATLTVLLTGAPFPAWAWGIDLAIHAAINGVFAPGVSAGLVLWLGWLAGDEVASNRPVPLESRSGAA
ncbi:MAG: rod shape-determining protein MreD [Myxococcota bacterium]